MHCGGSARTTGVTREPTIASPRLAGNSRRLDSPASSQWGFRRGAKNVKTQTLAFHLRPAPFSLPIGGDRGHHSQKSLTDLDQPTY
jgi:hypothetical protein